MAEASGENGGNRSVKIDGVVNDVIIEPPKGQVLRCCDRHFPSHEKQWRFVYESLKMPRGDFTIPPRVGHMFSYLEDAKEPPIESALTERIFCMRK